MKPTQDGRSDCQRKQQRAKSISHIQILPLERGCKCALTVTMSVAYRAFGPLGTGKGVREPGTVVPSLTPVPLRG